jgi:predicted alpha/beta hydrolase
MDRVNQKARAYGVPTPDGWMLALHRYQPAAPASGAVLLCSGYSCNRHFIDFDERHSLARFLARRGFDAWVVELRGRGMSRPCAGNSRPWRWTFDDLAQTDVPCAIRFVQKQVGHRRLCWVGHSMGAMVQYAHLGTAARDEWPAAIVTLASPVVFPAAASALLQRIGNALLALPFFDLVPQRAALGVLWHLVGRTRALEIGMNPQNIDRRVVGTALRRAIGNPSRLKLQQLARWSADGAFTSHDRAIDYRERLCDVDIPALVVAGGMDRLAPPECVAPAYEQFANSGKRFIVLDRAHGFGNDYGHVDIVLGRNAPDEVFPLLADWIAATLGDCPDGGG